MTELRRMDPSHLPSSSDRERKRRRGRLAVAGAGVMAVAVAVTAIVATHSRSAVTRPPAQSSRGAVAPVTGRGGRQPSAPFRLPARDRDNPAARLLAKIAVAAAGEPNPAVRDSEFMYIRSKVAYEQDTIVNGQETVTAEKLHERQVWLPVANECITGKLTEGGSSTPLSPFPVTNGHVDGPSPQDNFTCPWEGNLVGPTYRLLQSLPTNPNTLLKYLRRHGKKVNDDLATAIGDVIRESIVPPAVAAALYRVAALLPGATLVRNAANAVGRHGIGVAWPTGGPSSAGNRVELIFDKHTLQYIGERDYNIKTGEVSGESAILQRAFVDKLGQLP